MVMLLNKVKSLSGETESYEKGEHVFRNGTLLAFVGHLRGSV